MELPFFFTYDKRNQVINENCTNQKDIPELNNQYQVLTSYMTEKQMFDGINKRIGRVFYSKARANFNVSNSIEAFKKGQVMTRFDFLRKLGVSK